eukprot:COSAG02_NODE_21316_length_793_cov_1.694524_1_plen_141_part_01
MHMQTGDHLTEPNWVDRTRMVVRKHTEELRELPTYFGELLDEQSDASGVSIEELRDKVGKNHLLRTQMDDILLKSDIFREMTANDITVNDETSVFDSNGCNSQLSDGDPSGIGMTYHSLQHALTLPLHHHPVPVLLPHSAF